MYSQTILSTCTCFITRSICVAIHMANSEIHPHYNNSPLCGSFRCFSFLFTSRSSKGKQFDPKVNSCIHPICCLELFLVQISLISLSWKSVHRPPAAFPSPMQAEPLTCHWQGGVTNLFQPCCYIVATLLLLHCCCYIVAAPSLLLRIRQKPISSGQPSPPHPLT